MQKKPKIKPYQVQNSNFSTQEVFSIINRNHYRGYSIDYKYGGKNKIVVDTLFNYQRFLSELTEIPHIEFVTHRKLHSQKCLGDKIRIGIRHDLDSDIVVAVKQAEIEKKYGVVSSWYVLHTAPYYGYFKGGVFYRYRCMGYIYRCLQDLGHEVGLHTDPLMIYQEYKIDGAQALVTELHWLRSLGINVKGTVAHNSKSAYGAENYEIFKKPIYADAAKNEICNQDAERQLPPDQNHRTIKNEVFHNGKWAPLYQLDPEELGLEYEGNEILRQKETPLEYGATRMINQWRWISYSKLCKTKNSPLDTPFVDQERMLRDIRNLKTGTVLILVVHPCYYGSRSHQEKSPPLRLNKIEIVENSHLGWFTYKPETVQCWSNKRNILQEYQAINKSNEWGMLDLPISQMTFDDSDINILILGSENIDGRQVGTPIQFHSYLKKFLHNKIQAKVNICKLAFPNMGVSQLWSWYEKTRKAINSHIVLVGIGSQALRYSIPQIWSQERGLSPHHPPGDYLRWDPKTNTIQVIPYSPGWKIRQRKPRILEYFPGTNIPLNEIMSSEEMKLDGIDGLVYLTECYRYLCNQIRKEGAIPLLLIEECGEAAEYFHGKKMDTSNGYCISLFKQRFSNIANQINVPLIDPYEYFEQNADGLLTHYTHDTAWNATGHRLAAEATFLKLQSLQCI